jgi:hypothetical protein
MHDTFVCSAFQNLEENLVFARRFCRYVIDQDEDAIPFAPHLLFTQFLDNKNKDEWAKGFELGVARLLKSNEMCVFVRNGVITEGMLYEIDQAKNAGPKRRYFDATDIDNIVELRHLDDSEPLLPSDFLAPKPFASAASKGLDSIAAALSSGARYEDVQDQLESFLGPLDASPEQDPEADLAWESNYRSGRG